MSAQHIFDHPTRFVCGTIGEPGEREFFLQVRDTNRLLTVSIEKSQVQAVVDRLQSIVRQSQDDRYSSNFLEVSRDLQPLDSPIEPIFKVGAIAISFDEETQNVELDFAEETETEEDFDFSEQILEILRVKISIGYVKAFIRRSESVISAGRQPCPFCGGPIDPRGHLCPRANGYRR